MFKLAIGFQITRNSLLNLKLITCPTLFCLLYFPVTNGNFIQHHIICHKLYQTIPLCRKNLILKLKLEKVVYLKMTTLFFFVWYFFNVLFSIATCFFNFIIIKKGEHFVFCWFATEWGFYIICYGLKNYHTRHLLERKSFIGRLRNNKMINYGNVWFVDIFSHL